MQTFQQIKDQFGINPIVVKELRSRMRGARAFLTLTGMLLLLGLVSYGLYQLTMVSARYGGGMPLSPRIGQTLFFGLAFFELMLVSLITPAVTAGALSGEQEKQTYEMLLATPLRPASILWGKLVSSLSYVFLLLFASIPMAALVFIFGGVAARDMAKTLLVLLTVMVMAGVMGLFFSALFGRTGRATVVSYVVILLLLFGPLFAAFAAGIMRQAEPTRWLLVPSPITALMTALAPSVNPEGPGSIFWMFNSLIWSLTQTPVSSTGIPRPLYHYSLPIFGAITIVLYLLATRLVQPTRRWRIGWKNALAGLGTLVVFGGLVGAFFWTTADRYENVQAPVTQELPVNFAVPVPAMVERQVEVEAGGAPVGTPTPAAPPMLAPPLYPGPGEEAAYQVDSGDVLTDTARTQIYAAVIVRILDESPGGEPERLHLVGTTNDAVGDPQAPRSSPQTLAPALRRELETALEDIDFEPEVVWIERYEDGPWQDMALPEGEALVVLGNPSHLVEDVYLTSASLYYGQSAVGLSYWMEPDGTGWGVKGETGMRWER